MSNTFTLAGHSSHLTFQIFPPIQLDPNCEYSLGLTSLNTYNSIPNVSEDRCNKFYYKLPGNAEEKFNVITIPTGAYEISDIESVIRKQLLSSTKKQSRAGDIFSLKPNNNTLKSELISIFQVNFEPKDSVGKILGFSPKQLAANILHESDRPVDIIAVRTIRVECNIVTGSYYRGAASHTLYEFAPTVDPGFSINIEPATPTFLPIINDKYIDVITVDLLDQNGKSVNFLNEEIIVRLELRKSSRNGSGN